MDFDGSCNAIMVIQVPPAKPEDKPVYLKGNLFVASYRRNWEGDYLSRESAEGYRDRLFGI